MTRQFYTVIEFADIFLVNRRTIIKLIRDGHIRAIKLGKGEKAPYRIPAYEIIRLQQAGICALNPKLNKGEEEEIL